MTPCRVRTIVEVVQDNIEGPNWTMIRPAPTWDRSSAANIDALVPDADWFWAPLQRFCVPECCGITAYNFDADSVAWTCYLSNIEPDGNKWRTDEIGDAAGLAKQLRQSAESIRALDAEAVTATIFNEYMAPEGYATLFEDLAHKVETTLIGHCA